MDANKATLEDLLAYLFIARPDVKAYQAGPGPYLGAYYTHMSGRRDDPTSVYLPWTRAAIQEHLAGTATYGHYLVNTNNQTKILAFDIDIDQQIELPHLPMPRWDNADPAKEKDWLDSFCMTDGRAAWQQRSHPARSYLKQAMRSLAHVLERGIIDQLQIPTAVTYTGNKGLHVYGFPGLVPAKMSREGAELVLSTLPVKATRGKMIFQWDRTLDADRASKNTFRDHELFTIEVFPKQDEIGPDGFGNLMRLPLGKNQKSPDPTFFVDTDLASVPLGQLIPTDPLEKMRAIARSLTRSLTQ